MGKNEQLDKVSLTFVRITPAQKKYAKKLHKRLMRRIRKNINKPNPQHNRYTGWIG